MELSLSEASFRACHICFSFTCSCRSSNRIQLEKKADSLSVKFQYQTWHHTQHPLLGKSYFRIGHYVWILPVMILACRVTFSLVCRIWCTPIMADAGNVLQRIILFAEYSSGIRTYVFGILLINAPAAPLLWEFQKSGGIKTILIVQHNSTQSSVQPVTNTVSAC